MLDSTEASDAARLNPYRERDPFHGNTIVEIDVPSGQLIVSDALRGVPFFDVEPPASLNYGAGLNDWAVLLAQKTGVAYAYCGNTSPDVLQFGDGSLVVTQFDDDHPYLSREELHAQLGAKRVAKVCTDLWATMMVDYRSWLDHGGALIEVANEQFAFDTFTLVDVAPGRYRWTVYTHDDRFDIDADSSVFARLERIDVCAPTENPDA